MDSLQGSSMTEVKYGIRLTVFLPKAAVMGGTFHFSQTSAPLWKSTRRTFVTVESQELMQNTGNEEHNKREAG